MLYNIIQLLWSYRDDFSIVMGAVFIVAFIYHAEKIWSSNATLTSILGAGLLGSALPLYFGWNFGISAHAISFILLYIWCVLGMIFLAGRQTHAVKLMVGMASQGGILYALFRLI